MYLNIHLYLIMIFEYFWLICTLYTAFLSSCQYLGNYVVLSALPFAHRDKSILSAAVDT